MLRHAALALLLCGPLWGAGGCAKTAPPVDTGPKPAGASAQPDGKAEQPRTYVCERDDDCTVACTIPGDCCGDGCDCERVYHRDELDAVNAANLKACEGKDLDCPQVRCAEMYAPIDPKCTQGRCVGVPRANPAAP